MPGAEIFDQHVRRRDQLPGDGKAVRLLQVERQTYLVAVEEGEVAGSKALQCSGGIAADRLQADNLCTEVRQNQAGGRPHDGVAEIDDAQSGKR